MTAHAPIQMFQLSLPGFDGTFEELTGLVGLRRVSVADLPLAVATAQLAGYLRREPGTELEEIGVLVSGLARLLAVKSAGLLAEPALDDTIDEIAPRSGGIPRQTMGALCSSFRALEGHESFPPLVVPALVERQLEPRSANALPRMWAAMRQRSEPAARRVVVPGFARLEAALSSLIRRLRSGAVVSLSTTLRGATRDEAVVHFMAVLELVRRRQAQAIQPEPFADITLEYRERSADAAARAV